jgi:hypothetical protein
MKRTIICGMGGILLAGGFVVSGICPSFANDQDGPRAAVSVTATTGNELERLQGDWTCRDETLSIRGSTWSCGDLTGTLRYAGSDGRVDRIDMLDNDGPNVHVVFAIFRRENDTLHYCGSAKARPTRFVADIGEGEYWAFRRVSK